MARAEALGLDFFPWDMSHASRRDRRRETEATPRDGQRNGENRADLADRFQWRSHPFRRGPGPYGPPAPRPVHATGPAEPNDPAAPDTNDSSSDSGRDPFSITPDSQAGISASSSFDLVLHGPELDEAKAKFSSLYRAELAALFPTASKRSHAGRVSWMQRSIADSTWTELVDQAPTFLSNERLADWGNWCNAHARGHRGAGERRG